MCGEIHDGDKAECKEQATTKQCTSCGETKPLTEFHKRMNRKCGVQSRCKVCRNVDRSKHYAENRERELAYSAKYQKENPDNVRAKNQRRRAMKAGADGSHTAADWKARLDYHGYKCVYCGVEKHETPQKYLTMEHLIPLSRGGSNWPSNLAPSCQSCNSSKRTKTHFEYLEYLNDQEEV